jgi:hypothetical protein
LGQSLLTISRQIPPALTLLLGTLYAWNRGLAIGESSLLADTISRQFRRGFMGLSIYALVALLGRMPVPWETFGFFFFGVVSMALARLIESRIHIRSWDWGRRWMVSLIIAAGLTLATGLVGMKLLTTGDFTVTKTLFSVLGEIFAYLIGYLGLIPTHFLDWLLDTLVAFFSNRPFPNTNPLPPFSEFGGPSPDAAEPAGIQAVCGIVWPTLFLGLLILGILVITRRVGRARQRQSRTADVERESLQVSGSGLADGWQRVVDAARRIRLVPRYSTRNVRRIYASVLAYASELGHPCDEARTPYELLPVLKGTFSNSPEEIELITEAYIRAHYAEEPETKEELEAAREAWKRIQQQDIDRWSL